LCAPEVNGLKTFLRVLFLSVLRVANQGEIKNPSSVFFREMQQKMSAWINTGIAAVLCWSA